MKDSKLVGMEFIEGRFPNFPDMKVRLIQRSGHLILPPFEGYIIEPGDIMIVATTRDSLAELLSQSPGFLLSDDEAKIMEEGLNDESEEDSEEDILIEYYEQLDN